MAESPVWQKSSFSGDAEADCVELASLQGSFLLRESDEPDTMITTTPTGLAALIRHLR
ncbi:DUF397 domain-containing protein [Streptomyces sp. CA-251387]|uniref:DUF397 domain-containing protein n=1 Tax=Streptomyces sp. CA-251387 TaxID=3240064 RepID=UPI003D936338